MYRFHNYSRHVKFLLSENIFILASKEWLQPIETKKLNKRFKFWYRYNNEQNLDNKGKLISVAEFLTRIRSSRKKSGSDSNFIELQPLIFYLSLFIDEIGSGSGFKTLVCCLVPCTSIRDRRKNHLNNKKFVFSIKSILNEHIVITLSN